MKRIIQNSRILRVIFMFIFFIFLLSVYFKIINNSNINDFLVYSINNKFDNDDEGIFSKITYSSLNKIVDFNSKIISNKTQQITDNVNQENIIRRNDVIKKDPIIYIYNTHDTEKYYLPFSSGYSIRPTVKIASYILKDHLNDLGVSSYVEEKEIKPYLEKYDLDYRGCYNASRDYMKEASKVNDYKIYIDIHRDSVKYDLSLYEKDNKKYAKVLFVLGKKNKNYKYNLDFINYLNSKLNKDFKGLSRGIYERDDAIFNQDLSKNAILLEVGGVDNTIEEVNNTLYVFAKYLNQYIIDEDLNE